jgi:hypothetical protein
LEECGPCPVFASFTLAFALQRGKSTEKRHHGKTSARKNLIQHGKTSFSTENPQSSRENPQSAWNNLSQARKNLGQARKNLSTRKNLRLEVGLPTFRDNLSISLAMAKLFC